MMWHAIFLSINIPILSYVSLGLFHNKSLNCNERCHFIHRMKKNHSIILYKHHEKYVLIASATCLLNIAFLGILFIPLKIFLVA